MAKIISLNTTQDYDILFMNTKWQNHLWKRRYGHSSFSLCMANFHYCMSAARWTVSDPTWSWVDICCPLVVIVENIHHYPTCSHIWIKWIWGHFPATLSDLLSFQFKLLSLLLKSLCCLLLKQCLVYNKSMVILWGELCQEITEWEVVCVCGWVGTHDWKSPVDINFLYDISVGPTWHTNHQTSSTGIAKSHQANKNVILQSCSSEAVSITDTFSKAAVHLPVTCQSVLEQHHWELLIMW